MRYGASYSTLAKAGGGGGGGGITTVQSLSSAGVQKLSLAVLRQVSGTFGCSLEIWRRVSSTKYNAVIRQFAHSKQIYVHARCLVL
jgi:hypothetical protein